MIKTKTFDLIDYADNLSDLSDSFWENKLQPDIIHFITREKDVARNDLRIIINHPYEGNVLIIDGQYIFYYIHKLCEFLDLNPEHITFNTGNFLIFKQYYYWFLDNKPDTRKINLVCDFILSKIYAPKVFDIPNKLGNIPELSYETIPNEPIDKELVFNCLNKKHNRHRMTVYQQLSEKQLMHKGIVTFNMSGESTLTGILPEYLQKQLPIKYDVELQEDKTVLSYGDIEFTRAVEQTDTPKLVNNFADFFKKTHLTLVTETLYTMDNEFNDCSSRIPHYNGCTALMDWDKFTNRMICPVCDSQKVPVDTWVQYYHVGFITEKTFRQFLNGHPMLWIAPPYTIKMLKHLGFKTFDTVWEEDYDEIIDPRKRLARVITILEDLCDKDNAEWYVINSKLKPILEHNQQLMINLTDTPKLTWDNLPDWLINDEKTDLFNSYLNPEQGLQVVADRWFAGNTEKAKKILDIS